MLLKNTNDDEPPGQVSVPQRILSYIKNFYTDHTTATHVAIGALFAAILAALFHASPDSVLCSAVLGSWAGFLISSLGEGSVIVVGSLVGTMVAWLAGLHGEVALSVACTGAVWGFFLS